MTIPPPGFELLPSPHIKDAVTVGMVRGMGLLMLSHKVRYDPPNSNYVSYEDMQRLVQMRLCHPVAGGPRWLISSRLLREWQPYTRLRREYLELEAQQEEMLHKLQDFPYSDTRARQSLLKGLNDVRGLMSHLIMECGRSLALHWNDWLYEDRSAGVRILKE